MQIITALISALALASSTSALAVFEPVRRGEDLVYSPRITSPQRGDVWKVGTKQTVTWDKSSVPHNVYGKLLLGYLVGGSPDEHLDVGEFHFGPPLPHSTVRDVLFRAHMRALCPYLFV